MYSFHYSTFGFVAFFIFCLHSPSTNGQCSSTVGCSDCFSWCQLQAGACNVPLVQIFCRKTCNTCSPDSPVCKAMNCDHRCILSNDSTTATCECFDGYRLQSDKKSCKDVDECHENPRICDGIAARCVNLPGTYKCSDCEVAQNGITSYYSNVTQCCKISSPTGCGNSYNYNKRLVGGTIDIQSWPWQVYIKIQDRICSGSLITENYVLTAGHCIGKLDLKSLTIVAGIYNISDLRSIFRQTFYHKQIYRHPNYKVSNFDIAIIQLDHPAKLNRYVNTICLPGGDQPKVGEICYAIGYKLISNSAILQGFPYSIVNNSMCKSLGTKPTHPNFHICTKASSRGNSECKEISGGPFVCQRCNSCDWYLAGISLFENACSQFGSHKVFTRITAYQEWITEITKQEISYRRCVKPSWQSWSSWSECNATCGLSGFRSRTRLCSNGSVGDPGCYGKNIEKDDCIAPPCGGIFTPWSSNGNCSMPCGGGSRQRTRQCHFANGCFPDGDGSITTQFETCNTEECVGEWTTWNTVEDCSASCDGGTQLRTRFCTEASGNMATGCFGPSKQIVPCNTNKCSLVSCAEKVNLNEDKVCNVHALYNYCIVYYKYMEENCNLSCCQWRKSIGTFSPSYCGDLYSSQSCQSFWKNCIDPRMQKFCKKTCGIC